MILLPKVYASLCVCVAIQHSGGIGCIQREVRRKRRSSGAQRMRFVESPKQVSKVVNRRRGGRGTGQKTRCTRGGPPLYQFMLLSCKTGAEITLGTTLLSLIPPAGDGLFLATSEYSPCCWWGESLSESSAK